jgi:hypothetical protein
MFGIDDALVGAVAAPILGGLFKGFGQQSANQSNWDIAQSNNAFNERMASTQYQRAVGDMKAAGLSPMLAYSQGGNAAPSASSVSPMQNAIGAYGEGAQTAYSNYMDYARTNADVALKGAQTHQTYAETQFTHAKTQHEGVKQAYTEATTLKTQQEISNLKNANNLVSAQISNTLQQTLNLNAVNAQTLAQTILTGKLTIKAMADAGLATSATQTQQAQTALIKMNEKIREYQSFAEKNDAEKAKTWWGKNVSPYLQDFLGVSKMGATISSAMPK